MSTMASQITSVSMVCSTICWGAHQRKHQNYASLTFCEGNPLVTGGIPLQKASNAENVSIWWCHHALGPPYSRYDLSIDWCMEGVSSSVINDDPSELIRFEKTSIWICILWHCLTLKCRKFLKLFPTEVWYILHNQRHVWCRSESGARATAGINSLRPTDATWRHRSGSTLAQVMACCLTAPSHYLLPCWLIISKV